jgi:hypothetical protein
MDELWLGSDTGDSEIVLSCRSRLLLCSCLYDLLNLGALEIFSFTNSLRTNFYIHIEKKKQLRVVIAILSREIKNWSFLLCRKTYWLYVRSMSRFCSWLDPYAGML